jgi:hypothetical protein
MSFLGIDLSLRSTGLVFLNQDHIEYKLITSDAKKLNDEELLLYNIKEILAFIDYHRPKYIGLEGLSFGSVSSSKDILAGNFWCLRTAIYEKLTTPDIIPVLTWRSKLFDKVERAELKRNMELVKELKKEVAKLPKEEKKQLLLDNELLIERANIKYVTWEKLPEPIKSDFHKVGFTKGGFDLTDAYFIADFMRTKYGKV